MTTKKCDLFLIWFFFYLLTEAGKQALSLTGEKPTKIKPIKRPSSDNSYDLNTVKNFNAKSNVEKSTPKKKFLKIDNSPIIEVIIKDSNNQKFNSFFKAKKIFFVF